MTRYKIKYTKTESYDKTLTLIVEANSETEALKITNSEDLDGLFSQNEHENQAIIHVDLEDYDPEVRESIQLDDIDEVKE